MTPIDKYIDHSLWYESVTEFKWHNGYSIAIHPIGSIRFVSTRISIHTQTHMPSFPYKWINRLSIIQKYLGRTFTYLIDVTLFNIQLNSLLSFFPSQDFLFGLRNLYNYLFISNWFTKWETFSKVQGNWKMNWVCFFFHYLLFAIFVMCVRSKGWFPN